MNKVSLSQLRLQQEAVMQLQPEILLCGRREEVERLDGIKQSVSSFQQCFSDVYFDEDRMDACKVLCPTLSELFSGRLEGQKRIVS